MIVQAPMHLSVVAYVFADVFLKRRICLRFFFEYAYFLNTASCGPLYPFSDLRVTLHGLDPTSQAASDRVPVRDTLVGDCVVSC